METRSIALSELIKALHPRDRTPVKVVGVTDEETSLPKLVILVNDQFGTRAEVVEDVQHDARN